jgi:hypothetical protein
MGKIKLEAQLFEVGMLKNEVGSISTFGTILSGTLTLW